MYYTRRTPALLVGRTSLPNATYFLTICEAKRRPGLTTATIVDQLQRTLQSQADAGDLRPLAGVVMPDHVRLLARLGNRLPLSRVIGKLKAHTRRVLAEHGLAWQENFFDHRLRPDEAGEAYGLYMFLNPYRAKLIPNHARWPHWWRWGDSRFRFEASLACSGDVPSEWFVESVPIGVGE